MESRQTLSRILYERASLRRLLWRQAQNDPAQARFLAKDTRWLKMDDGKISPAVVCARWRPP